MLLFIAEIVLIRSPPSSFQYISCYCLSEMFETIEVPNSNFNTSHVTVYRPMKKVKQFSTSKFQYISCYCLSVLYKRKKLGTTTFQYISCYCLSSCSSNRDINTSNFNTSHVTVYPITIDTKRFQFCDFNTSHVTVYQCFLTFFAQIVIFQYISCYCLSIFLPIESSDT